MIISERIFKLMQDKGISQIEFSRKTGIAQSTISDWKRKKTNPVADKIMCICDALGVTPYDLLQDSVKHSDGADYIITGEGTDAYHLLEIYEKIDSKKKQRLMGYAEALCNSEVCQG